MRIRRLAAFHSSVFAFALFPFSPSLCSPLAYSLFSHSAFLIFHSSFFHRHPWHLAFPMKEVIRVNKSPPEPGLFFLSDHTETRLSGVVTDIRNLDEILANNPVHDTVGILGG